MAIRETYVPISDATPVVLVDPATGDYYTLTITAGAWTINRTNGTPISNALPVVLVDPTAASGNYYKATGTTGGGGFADQGRATVVATDTFVDIVFNVAGTDPIPTVLYTTWGSPWYPTNITATGFRANFLVEVPVGGGTVGWAYVEA